MSYLRLAQALPKVFGKGRGGNNLSKKGFRRGAKRVFPTITPQLKKEKSI